MNDAMFWSRVAEKAEQIFMTPGRTHPWEVVISGVPVNRSGGRVQRIPAVDGNTWRSLPKRKDKAGVVGPKRVYTDYFLSCASEILKQLETVADRKTLHQYLDKICREIKQILEKEVEPDKLTSYYRIKKPVDLYVEHLVAMAQEITDAVRQRLVPLLFLPIDRQMIAGVQTEAGIIQIFDPFFLNKHKLTTSSNYGEINTEPKYLAFQEEADQRAKSVSELCGRPFHPVYFDLLWENRYAASGENLVELNPAK